MEANNEIPFTDFLRSSKGDKPNFDARDAVKPGPLNIDPGNWICRREVIDFARQFFYSHCSISLLLFVSTHWKPLFERKALIPARIGVSFLGGRHHMAEP